MIDEEYVDNTVQSDEQSEESKNDYVPEPNAVGTVAALGTLH